VEGIMINKENILKTITELKKDSKKRNFIQNYDLVITLKNLDLKKPEQKVDFYTILHFNKGKKIKIGAFVGMELYEEAKKVFDLALIPEEFEKYSDKKASKKLADEYDIFIAQANIMTQVAKSFGKTLGVKGKMPNPKAGCVVPPKGVNLEQLYTKLQKTVRIITKNNLMIQCVVGNQDSKDEEIAINVLDVIKQLIAHLPNHENNISKFYLKLTMSKPIEIIK
jgi:large subunit ribosomal protein L1